MPATIGGYPFIILAARVTSVSLGTNVGPTLRAHPLIVIDAHQEAIVMDVLPHRVIAHEGEYSDGSR